MGACRTNRGWVPRSTVILAAALSMAACVPASQNGPGPGAPSASISVAPADYASATQFGGGPSDVSLTNMVTFPAGTATLTGPHFVLQLDWSAVATAFDEEQAAMLGLAPAKNLLAVPMKAAPGHEFLLAYVGFPKNDPPLGGSGAKSESATASVLVDGQARHVNDDKVLSRDMIIVSVQTGSDAMLQLTDHGRTQSISLRTGKRGADAVPLFYPIHTGGLDKELESDVIVHSPHGDYYSALSSSTMDNVTSLQPYVDDGGWAPAGRAWLVVDLSIDLFPGDPQDGVTVTLDLARSFKLSTGDASIAARPGSLAIAPSSLMPAAAGDGEADVVFSVPDTFRSGTLSFTPAGQCTKCTLIGGQRLHGVPSMPVTLN